jgi:protease-4
MEGEESFSKKQIDRVREDKSVIGVVLRINSPGGTVTGSDYLYHHLQELKKEREQEGEKFPMIVSMGSICASGGYYIAMAVGDQKTAILAEPTTWTGSIGVIIPHFDLSDTLDKIGAEDDSIASGPLKQMGSPTKKMSEEDRKVLQELVDESFKGFKDIVINGRPAFKDDQAALDAVTTGQIFTAKQALDKGLVDKIGFVEDAVARAAELAGKTTDEVRCVKYEEPPTLMSALVGTGAIAPTGRGIDLGALLDLTAPRAYYLWSWLPTLMTNSH